jgi:hypothetical protein
MPILPAMTKRTTTMAEKDKDGLPNDNGGYPAPLPKR